MTESVEELKAKIAKLQAEVAAKKKTAEAEIARFKKEEFERETPARRFATSMHECTCHSNHEDGCGWYYDSSWDDYAHKTALEQANRILKALPPFYTSNDYVDRIANAFAGYDVVKRMNKIEINRKKGGR
jgi:hypothetical protein